MGQIAHLNHTWELIGMTERGERVYRCIDNSEKFDTGDIMSFLDAIPLKGADNDLHA